MPGLQHTVFCVLEKHGRGKRGDRLKKGMLKKIPYLNADEKDREFIRIYGHSYLAKPEPIVVNGQKILLLNIYKWEQLQKGITVPMYRVFEGKKEFITEKTDGGTWTVHTLKHLIYEYRNGECPRVVMRKKSEENIVKHFFRKGKTKQRAIDLFLREQEKIKEKELFERKRKKLKKAKRLFAGAKQFSPAFLDWLDNQAMYSSQYILYDYSRKKHIPCICTHCRAEFELDNSIPRHNQMGICPVCKRPAHFKARGKVRSRWIKDRGEAVKLERIESGILIRHIALQKFYQIDKPETWKTIAREDYRVILGENGNVRYFEWEYWRAQKTWKQIYLNPHFYCTFHMPYTIKRYECLKNMPGVLYMRNLKRCLYGTSFQYSGLDLYAEKYRHEAIAVKRYLEAYLKFPQLEYFVKAQLYQLGNELIWNQINQCINLYAKDLKNALLISKEEIRTLQKYNLGSSYVEFFQKLHKYHIVLNETEKINFLNIYGMNELLLEMNSIASIRKIASYLAKQLERSEKCKGYRMDCDLPELSKKEQNLYRNIAKDWLDYIAWAETLGHDISSRAVLFPKELKKAHDQMYKSYQEFQKKEERKRLREMRNTVNQMFREERKYLEGKIENKDYLFAVPEKWQDLREEGDVLGHCVGSYVEYIAQKQCSVYFIRKKKEPEKPFYTVELQKGRLVQCQGKGRCAPTKEVSEFLTYATKKLQNLKATEKKAA